MRAGPSRVGSHLNTNNLKSTINLNLECYGNTLLIQYKIFYFPSHSAMYSFTSLFSLNASGALP